MDEPSKYEITREPVEVTPEMRAALDAWRERQMNPDPNALDYLCFVCGTPCTASVAWTTSYIAEADKAICPVHGLPAYV